jgi:hypothetical protein
MDSKEEKAYSLNEENNLENEINDDYKFDLTEDEIIRRYLKEKNEEMKEYCKFLLLNYIFFFFLSIIIDIFIIII